MLKTANERIAELESQLAWTSDPMMRISDDELI